MIVTWIHQTYLKDICRVANGLLKTSLGPPSGSTTTLSTVQDIFLRHESVQCLVSVIKSMGAWMDQQLKIGDSDLPRSFESDTSSERPSTSIVEDGVVPDCELHPEMNFELSDTATVEDWSACSNMKLAMHIKPCSRSRITCSHCYLVAF